MPIDVFTHYDKPAGPQGLVGLVSSLVRKESAEPTILPFAGYVAVSCLGVAIGHYAGMWLGYFIKTL